METVETPQDPPLLVELDPVYHYSSTIIDKYMDPWTHALIRYPPNCYGLATSEIGGCNVN
jgi:hypothetical protein